ncbi:MAG: tetraacyldisaccharide 4'-kinase, partial [Ferrovibrio sp.]|nr:tetraacyldisaccharide 4'-kinase [Ferrovibrio sp.]
HARAPQLVTAASDPALVGDESVLIARRAGCMVAIGRRRAAAAIIRRAFPGRSLTASTCISKCRPWLPPTWPCPARARAAPRWRHGWHRPAPSSANAMPAPARAASRCAAMPKPMANCWNRWQHPMPPAAACWPRRPKTCG